MPSYPSELQNLRQWVCWRLKQRTGKATKIPICPNTGANAKMDDPSTWGAFDTAIARMHRFGCQGIGFVFTADDPYFGVDLDKCIDAITGEIVPWTESIIDRLNTYTELSQSCTGLHLIGTGTLPPGRRKKGAIEMYDTGRFFALTGQHYSGAPLTIEHRQAEIVALHRELFPPAVAQQTPSATLHSVSLTDADLLDKIFTARNGADVRRLWDGNLSDYASHSEADLALCSHLAFWTGGDAARIDALFRQSGLYRQQKWGRQDYRQRTIGKALAQAQCYTPSLRDSGISLRDRAVSGADLMRCSTLRNSAVSASDLLARSRLRESAIVASEAVPWH